MRDWSHDMRILRGKQNYPDVPFSSEGAHVKSPAQMFKQKEALKIKKAQFGYHLATKPMYTHCSPVV